MAQFLYQLSYNSSKNRKGATMKRRRVFWAILVLSMAFFTTTATGAVPNPTVIGPIPVTVPLGDPSHNYPQLATQADMESYGYIEQEFFFQGTATYYSVPALATGAVISTGHAYKTRMLVRRPTSPAKFNGTVIVEWVNVTSGYNLDAMWQSTSDALMRQGYVYVGVSAQRVGVQASPSGLKYWCPPRYGTLDVTAGGAFMSDQLSYDIFSQAAQAIRNPVGVDPLGGLPVKLIIATGVSQSEGYLVRYYNSVHPIVNVYDGFYLFLGIGGKLRTDIPTKVFKLNTENDVLLLGEAAARQDDSDRLRTWEVAGASHVSYPSTLIRTPLLIRDGLPVGDTSLCSKQPALSHIPTAHVMKAIYGHLVAWIVKGTPPPAAPRIELTSLSPATANRDAFGNALGGIQLSQLAVPTATNTGVNSGPGFCFLYGSYTPFDQATLDSLYRNHGSYVSNVAHANNYNLSQGYILGFDANANKEEAAHSSIGK